MQERITAARAGCIASGTGCAVCTLICGYSAYAQQFNASVAVIGVGAAVLYVSAKRRLKREKAAALLEQAAAEITETAEI